MLKDILEQSKSVAVQTFNARVPGVDGASVTDVLVQASSSKGALQAFSSMASIAVDVACSATGPYAPICSLASKGAVALLGSLQAKPVGPQPTPDSERLKQVVTSELAFLEKEKERLLFELQATLQDDVAFQEAKKVLDAYYPERSKEYPMTSDGVYIGEAPFIGLGFYIPLLAVNACRAIGAAYSPVCSLDFWEWQADYSGMVSGKKKFSMNPGWVQALFGAVAKSLAKEGIDVKSSFALILSDNEKKASTGGRWFHPDRPVAVSLGMVYSDLKAVVWPALEKGMRRKLEEVSVKSLARTASKAALSILKIEDQLAKLAPWKDRGLVQKDAARAFAMLQQDGTEEVYAMMRKEYPDVTLKVDLGASKKKKINLAPSVDYTEASSSKVDKKKSTGLGALVIIAIALAYAASRR